MKERPILFSSESIKAILEGRKTQTRRVVTPNNSVVGVGKVDWSKFDFNGQAIYKDTCKHKHTELHQAPLPFVDGKPETGQYLHVPYNWAEDMTIFRIFSKYKVGDRLWVKETWATERRLDHLSPSEIGEAASTPLWYKADDIDKSLLIRGKWRPSIFIPRWASRILLEITEVRVERLQEITIEDCFAEGIEFSIRMKDPTELYKALWNSLNAKRGYGWDKNLFVWVIIFRRIKL